jgi:hypothetical protein
LLQLGVRHGGLAGIKTPVAVAVDEGVDRQGATPGGRWLGQGVAAASLRREADAVAQPAPGAGAPAAVECDAEPRVVPPMGQIETATRRSAGGGVAYLRPQRGVA